MGLTSPVFNVTVTPLVPASITLQNITTRVGRSICYNATQTITLAGNGTAFIIPAGSVVTMIAGENILIYANAAVQPGGYLHGYFTSTGQWCNSIKSTQTEAGDENTYSEAKEIESNAFRVTAYPNPVTGLLHVVWSGGNSEIITYVEVYSLFGTSVAL